jgi:surfactin synthase thioesterase subunit
MTKPLHTLTAPARPLPPVAFRPWPVPLPRLRIFLFHHAGGSHHFFRGWGPYFPADWEIVLMEVPGRSVSPEQHPCADLDEVTDLFLRHIQPWIDRPYAFFGHSMGALVSNKLTHHLHADGHPGPVWLGLSAWSPDHTRLANREPGRHLLPDDELRAFLRHVGGTPPEILESETLWRLFSSTVRDDFRLIDTCAPIAYATLEDVPQSVFGGKDDTLLPVESLIAWADRHPRLTGMHLYSGDHFYLHPHRRKIVSQITTDVLTALRETPGSATLD